MALRRQVSEARATFPDPVRGLNLRAAEQDLQRGEARLMQNCVYDGGTRSRKGSGKITTTTLDATKRIRGLTKFYYGGVNPTGKRLVAYSTKISVIADVGTETILNSGMTSDLDTFFCTWTIDDKVYISNGTDVIRSYDGTTFATVAGTNIPTARGPIIPVSDRLLCITTNGIERSDPRSATIWSSNSSWATFRPQQAGLFTALHAGTMKGADTIYSGAFAFQANAHYLIQGTDFGSSVIAGTASAGEDASIQLMDPRVGTSSPYSIVSVPGVGIFWITSDVNVYMISEGTLTGKFVGDKLVSNNSTDGLENVNRAAISQIWGVYWNRYLIFGFPMGSDTWPSTQFWLDLRGFDTANTAKEGPNAGIVWYGPMTGQTVGRAFAETQNGNNTLSGGEGNPTTGAFVYELQKASTFTDAIGTVDTNITVKYRTHFEDFGAPSREKYVRAIHFDLQVPSGSALANIYDLDGLTQFNVPIEEVD